MAKYNVVGVPTKISAVSRVSLKIKDNFYTIEAAEERTLPIEQDDIDMDKEWEALFNEINNIVDGQAEDIAKTVNKR